MYYGLSTFDVVFCIHCMISPHSVFQQVYKQAFFFKEYFFLLFCTNTEITALYNAYFYNIWYYFDLNLS